MACQRRDDQKGAVSAWNIVVDVLGQLVRDDDAVAEDDLGRKQHVCTEISTPMSKFPCNSVAPFSQSSQEIMIGMKRWKWSLVTIQLSFLSGSFEHTDLVQST